MKRFDVFFNFDGDCREAMEFYARVFGEKIPERIMTYDQMPGGCPPADNGRILYASMPIFGCNVMFSDAPAGTPHVKGTNVSPTLGCDDPDEIRRIYEALLDGGRAQMPLGKTFFSDLYGMVTDRHEITWQISLPPKTE
ncbi:MAG: VOC family protein [Treponema sp.]|nr:VOC family protein [Treponema sp.]